MRWFHGSLPLLALAVVAGSAPAQGYIVVNPYLGGGSFTYTRSSRYGYFLLSSGRYPPVYIGYPRVVASSLNIVTIAPTSVIIVPRSSLGLDDDTTPKRDLAPRREAAPELVPAPQDKPLPGRDAGEFRPLAPDNRKQAERPIIPEPLPKKLPEEMPLPPRLPMPEANPIAENARLIKLGQAAFAAQEYGRATQRFRQATTVLPNDSMSQFLLAQALLALGKYDEAVAAINAGMALRPDWPLQRFRIPELYGDNAAAYPDRLRRLEDTLTKFPNDPVLLFLFGYQLWFSDRKAEARALFQRARPNAANKEVIDRFLQVKPAVPVAAGNVPRGGL